MSGDERRLVVVGASLAGLRAVEAARKAGHRGEVVLVGGERHLPYDRPPLSKTFLDAARDEGLASPPYFRDEAVLRGELRVDVRLSTWATALDTTSKIVTAGGESIPYDALIIATGAEPRKLPVADGLPGVRTLRTLDDSLAIRAAFEAGARTVVVGAGFIGSEIASAARKRGLSVTIVEAQPVPLVRAAGPQMGAALAALHDRHGTDLRCGVAVQGIEGDGKVERVVLDDGTVVPADLVVVGIGVSPSVGWLAGSGLALENGIQCDETLRTVAPGVYAAGDVAHWHNHTMGERQRMENWTAAAEQGAVAARNALNPDAAKPYGTVPYYWSDWYGLRIQFVGSPEADEVRLVDGDVEDGERWVALYRRADRLIGALTLNGPGEIMKYRNQIAAGGSWNDALAFANKRRKARADRRPIVPVPATDPAP